jgi:hypothetical protein
MLPLHTVSKTKKTTATSSNSVAAEAIAAILPSLWSHRSTPTTRAMIAETIQAMATSNKGGNEIDDKIDQLSVIWGHFRRS